MADGHLLLAAGALLTAGLLASLLAGRLRVPGLVVLLGVGMAIGSDGLGWIDFDDYGLARTVGIVALSFILFEGGLSAGWSEIRPVVVPAVALATVGTLITALATGLAATALFDLELLEGLLVGAILSSTDGAAIFSLLRGSTLRRRLARTLEGESGMNDPIAVLLVLGFIEWLEDPAYGITDLLGHLVLELGIGLAIGLLVGLGMARALTRVRLASAGLYPVASLAAVALSYGLADSLGGSGFLAVYLAGLVLGSVRTPAQRTITTFHDGVAWVSQLTMFLVLGLLVFPGQLGDVALEGTLLAVVLAVVARPIAAFVATVGLGYEWRERLVLGWAGLRGAVPVVLATFPVIAGVENSLLFFNLVFFAVLLSTIVQGTTFEPLARALGVTTSEAALPLPLVDPYGMRRLGAEVVEFPVGRGDAAAGRRVRELGLPRDALLNLIVRGEQAIPPRGSTVIQAGDRLHILVRQEIAVEFRQLLERWRTGPLERPQRPRRPPRSAPAVFTTRPWRAEDGDAARPERVAGIAVVEQLRTRRDRPGALVVLADGRYAVSGPLLAVGSAQALQRAARRRVERADDPGERAWWGEVIGALAAER